MRIVPWDMRAAIRATQIEAIKAEIRRRYRKRIRTANTAAEKKALKAQREAEIAKRIEPLIQEGKRDTPECL